VPPRETTETRILLRHVCQRPAPSAPPRDDRRGGAEDPRERVEPRAAMERRSPPLLNQETTPGGGAFKHNQSFRHGPGACACAQARFDSFSYLIRAPVRSNHRDIQRLSRAAPMANTTDDAPPPPLFQSVLSHRVHSSARVPSIHPTFLRLLRPVIPSIDPCVQIKKGYPTLNNRPATTLCS
jgi:hypothetical protein